MNRCEKTDLPVDQCAGNCCRPDLTPAPTTPTVVARFAARFDSDCDSCGGRMFEGDPIARTDSGDYVHDECSAGWPSLTFGGQP